MTSLVKIKKGNFPLIISVPHGGILAPRGIPNRVLGVTETDVMTRQLAKFIYNRLSGYNIKPHLLILNVSRRKVDVNRSKKLGCEHLDAEIIWDNYHDNLQLLISSSIDKYGCCFLIDLHGQDHNNKIEIGYCLNKNQLNKILKKTVI